MSRLIQILFARPPAPGRVKTRIARVLGERRALRLYETLLERALAQFRADSLYIYSAEADGQGLLARQLERAGAAGAGLRLQRGADLGERMARAIAETAGEFAGREPDAVVLLAGTDIPGYTRELALLAAQSLNAADAVLGPTLDGGYYLIGMSVALAADEARMLRIFADLPWSHPDTLARQAERLAAEGLRIARAPTLRDIDEFDDLAAVVAEGADWLREHLPDVRAVLPVLNEAENLPHVLPALRASPWIREVIVADNGSTDDSPGLAAALGARVTFCTERGYGATCLTALANIAARGGCDAVVFLDADGSDDPAELEILLAPIFCGAAALCLGARTGPLAAPGALLPHQRAGNALATWLIRLFWGRRYEDLGPYRAIEWAALQALRMDDRNYGWTIQMQIRALQRGLKIVEAPVRARRRLHGKSKVTGTLIGSIQAGRIILSVIFREFYLQKFGKAARADSAERSHDSKRNE